MPPDGTSGNRRPAWANVAWLASPAVFIVLFAVVWVAHGIEPAPGGTGFVCAHDETDEGECDRLMREMSRRSAPNESNRAAAQRWADTIERDLATRQLERCLPPCTGTDFLPSVNEVRAWLMDAGHDEAVVRPATADDPAPAGSIVYAVGVGPDCIVGHLAAGGTTSRAYVLGTLPSGTCLDD